MTDEAQFRVARIKDRLRQRGLHVLLAEIADQHHVLIDELLSRSKKKAIVTARHAFLQALHAKSFSWPQISELFEMNIAAKSHAGGKRSPRGIEARVVKGIAMFLREEGRADLAKAVEEGAWKRNLPMAAE